jgi:perosamine synthetase
MSMKNSKMILTAGPSITQKEIDYVTDAITNGHDEHWGDYIKKFEIAFAQYIGVKYALTTSSCTGALHLALLACDIKEGDEVIVPDCSWIATASVVRYVGATPVFVDVLKNSWCISPTAILKAITSKTKAIIPVHLYGYPADMISILKIARDNNLRVIEDAAPSIGAEIEHRRTGSFGDIGCFSFQGAKLLSTGEGGMLVTDNQELFDKAKHFAEHGRSGVGFDISDIGYKYKMSNLQAAWGLAQLERIDELLVKRHLIYFLYEEELRGIEGVMLSKRGNFIERPNYWMTSVVLLDDFKITRDEVMLKLKEKGIDSRPVFPPMSSFRMFKEKNNPVAKIIGEWGINLPSAHRITQEEIIYVCNCLKDILGL